VQSFLSSEVKTVHSEIQKSKTASSGVQNIQWEWNITIFRLGVGSILWIFSS